MAYKPIFRDTPIDSSELDAKSPLTPMWGRFASNSAPYFLLFFFFFMEARYMWYPPGTALLLYRKD
jgi:hypothetical protein